MYFLSIFVDIFSFLFPFLLYSTFMDGIDVSDAELNAINEEAKLYDESAEELARRLFRENLPLAVISIGNLARNASNEKIRLDASQYIVERNLGRVQDGNSIVKNPLDEFIHQINKKSSSELAT